MALPEININKIDGNVGVATTVNDGVTGFIFYDSTLTQQTIQLFELNDLKNEGIDEDSTGVEAIVFYHIKNYFKRSNFKCWIKLCNTIDTYSDIDTIQNLSNGEIKIIAIWDNINNFAITNVETIDTEIVKLATERKMPAVAMYSAKSDDVTSLLSLTTADAQNVQVIEGQDFTTDSEGLELYTTSGFCGVLGAVAGLTSSLNVHESASWVEKGNIEKDGEFAKVGFTDGSLFSEKSKTFLDSLHDKKYTFLRKLPNKSGTYLSFDWTAKGVTDYDQLCLNRVYNKSYDLIYLALINDLNGPAYLENGGNLSEITKTIIKTKVDNVLDTMLLQGNISGYQVIIPSQNVGATKSLRITAKVIPVGTLSKIDVDFNYVLTL